MRAVSHLLKAHRWCIFQKYHTTRWHSPTVFISVYCYKTEGSIAGKRSEQNNKHQEFPDKVGYFYKVVGFQALDKNFADQRLMCQLLKQEVKRKRIKFIHNLSKYTFSLPLQVLLSLLSKCPSKQSHSNPPIVFLHLCEHGFFSNKHSSMSSKWKEKKRLSRDCSWKRSLKKRWFWIKSKFK